MRKLLLFNLFFFYCELRHLLTLKSSRKKVCVTTNLVNRFKILSSYLGFIFRVLAQEAFLFTDKVREKNVRSVHNFCFFFKSDNNLFLIFLYHNIANSLGCILMEVTGGMDNNIYIKYILWPICYLGVYCLIPHIREFPKFLSVTDF